MAADAANLAGCLGLDERKRRAGERQVVLFACREAEQTDSASSGACLP